MSQGLSNPDAGDGNESRGLGPTGAFLSSHPPTPGTSQSKPILAQISLEPGQVLLGRYKLINEIGRGGMGCVWQVQHQTLERNEALKLILPSLNFDDQVRRRFRREAVLMARLVHPNAVTVYDSDIGPDAAYIAMELIGGSSLDRTLRKGTPLSLDMTADILEPLCDVLQVAHDLKIIHRDLKPSNLMLVKGRERRDSLKVLDFGIAKVFEGNQEEALTTVRDGFLGTISYASPEQCDPSLGDPDARSDLYSVGVMLYEFLTGYRPFQGMPIAQLNSHLHIVPPPFSVRNPDVTVPSRVEQVVMRCLEKNPANRPESASELKEEFLQAVGRPKSVPKFDPNSGRTQSGTLPMGGFPSNRGSATPSAMAEGVENHSPIVTPLLTPSPSWGTEVEPPETYLPPLTAPATPAPASHPWRRPDPTETPRSGSWWTPSVRGALALCTFTLAAVLGVALYLGSGVTDSGNDRPRDPRTQKATQAPQPPPPGLPEALRAWEKAGYLPSGPGYKPADGWPKVLVNEIGFHFDRTESGLYLPAGFEPSSVPASDGWPSTLTRRDSGNPGPVTLFVRIPGGEFTMGSDTVKDAGPPHQVRLSGFYIQKTEVTNGEMLSFEETLGPDQRKRLALWRRHLKFLQTVDHIDQAPVPRSRRHPAYDIDYPTAEAFAVWAKGRLPTEAQWEYAARSRGREIKFPWDWRKGIDADQHLANLGVWRGGDDETDLVGSFPEGDATEQRVCDLAGNVREWCRDVWAAPYPVGDDKPALDPCETSPDPEAIHVVRGGCWDSELDEADVHFRTKELKVAPGFRLVIECPAPPLVVSAGGKGVE